MYIEIYIIYVGSCKVPMYCILNNIFNQLYYYYYYLNTVLRKFVLYTLSFKYVIYIYINKLVVLDIVVHSLIYVPQY